MERQSKTKTAFGYFLTVSIILALHGCGDDADKSEPAPVVRPVKIFTIQAAGQTSSTLPGRIRASQSVDLAFRVSGPLIELPVIESQEVSKGGAIARIDPRDFERRRADLKSSLDGAQAELRAMRAGARPEDIQVLQQHLMAATAKFSDAKQQSDRAQRLFEKDLLAETQVESFKAALDVAEAQMRSASQELETGKKGSRQEDIDAKLASIRGLDAQLQQAQDALDDTVLKAPFDGVVAKTHVENHQIVQANQQIVSFQDVSDLEIIINVPETSMALRRRDNIDRIEIAFDALPGEAFRAEIKEFGTEADPDTQTYPVTLTMPQPDGIQALPGMTVQATAYAKQGAEGTAGSIEIPANAVVTTPEGKNLVWVVDASTMLVQAREVEMGQIVADRIKVLSGLELGEKIATSGVHQLREGTQVSEMERLMGSG